MSTVILDPEQKARIQEDINEFLHPLSTEWYATRGIPYRRGYLFHGPPGTGKTSLSFALAGLFGLGIYIIPLMDPELTEAYLGRLFNTLPRRCIVLLEDIDTAGVANRDEDADNDEDDEVEPVGESHKKTRMGKRGDESGTGSKEKSGAGKDEKKILTNGEVNGEKVSTNGEATTNKVTTNGETQQDTSVTKTEEGDQAGDEQDSPDPQKLTLTDLAKVMLSISNPDSTHRYHHRAGRLYRRRRRNEDPSLSTERISNISLSGLLNVIDGVATHEGRVLIMTTNHPEKLDSALIRAGRVDMQVKFTYATRQQIKYLFTRMYQHDIDLSVPPSSSHEKNTTTIADALSCQDKNTQKPASISEAELERIAQEFAEKLPEEKFAPSDIQGYLLVHKKSPWVALDEVDAWREKRLTEMAEKAAKEKLKRERAGAR
jgi:chaperone BCS1